MKLVLELADDEGLDEASQGLAEWYSSPAQMVSPYGVYVLIESAVKPLGEFQFAWRITGLEVQP